MCRATIVKAVLLFFSYATAMPCYCEVTSISAERLNSMLAAKDGAAVAVDVGRHNRLDGQRLCA